MYYTDKLNKSTVAPSYLGKASKNLVKTASTTTGDITINTLNVYELDNSGYVTKETTTTGSSVSTQISAYECN